MSYLEVMWLINADKFYTGIAATCSVVGALIVLKFVLEGLKWSNRQHQQSAHRERL